ncbi:MAG: P-II family nitrogen regulator [Thermodesulfobacteriota bacterium]|nr:P-II family nitrogen regulator [Thermodesulfobacteriota bacterium]
MKRIIAMIKPNMLDDVIFALHKIENFPGATMTEVRGLGQGFRRYVQNKSTYSPLGYPPQVRIEIICLEAQTEEIISTIEQSARTGKSGDGKIFISPVEEAVRIRTGQRGNAVI